MLEHWGPPPGTLYVDDGDIVLAALQYGNVVLMIQPPRGFGENPIAIYHDPDLPPSHHYLAAVPLAGLPAGRAAASARTPSSTSASTARSSGCPARARACPRLRARRGARRPAAVLPVHRQRPGRGHAGQAPRPRDRRRPPRAADGRAESYDEMAQLEQLLDEYAQVQAMDPAKLPTIRAQIWELVEQAQLHHDLHVSAMLGMRASTTSCCTSTATSARSRTS
jgi:cobaltochelatase CobN